MCRSVLVVCSLRESTSDMTQHREIRREEMNIVRVNAVGHGEAPTEETKVSVHVGLGVVSVRESWSSRCEPLVHNGRQHTQNAAGVASLLTLIYTTQNAARHSRSFPEFQHRGSVGSCELFHGHQTGESLSSLPHSRVNLIRSRPLVRVRGT